MCIVVDRHQGPPPGEDDIIAMMRAEGLAPHAWGNAPGDTYGWHERGYEKVLYCTYMAGSYSAPGRMMPIWVPETGWCCHRTPRTRPPWAPKGAAAWRPHARVKCQLAE
jgi:hypothetical protein